MIGTQPQRVGIDRGQVMIVVLLGMSLLSGLVFYVVNVGDHVNRRLAMQNAADASAMAGAQAICVGTPGAAAPAEEYLAWGAGPRAGQYLIIGGKAFAAANGRVSVSCADVRKVAAPVLRHRIAANFQAQAQGITSVDLVGELLKDISHFIPSW